MTVDKSPLVLLHPATSSGRVWRELEPMLSGYHELDTPTLVGHRGGPVPQRRPVTSRDIVDSAEAYLDAHGLDRPHRVGNSGGGSVAIELARRGRAASVCALSPGGLWSDNHGAAARRVHRLIRIGGVTVRLLNPVAPLLLKTAAGRRFMLRQFVCHGDRLSAERARELYFEDAMACTIMEDAAG
ncbi:alpha/beta fold hydrolase [Mycobacterium simiae]|uniref:alpha/beta fold hydrolase n=1 Tax=Mycobacterium simiae TaxID=1784 RepID=UPI00041A7C06|nr:alpha/beta hydrolase [Mycobacterium simiae]